MAERFSQKNLRVRPSSDEEKIVTNAKKHFEKTLLHRKIILKVCVMVSIVLILTLMK